MAWEWDRRCPCLKSRSKTLPLRRGRAEQSGKLPKARTGGEQARLVVMRRRPFRAGCFNEPRFLSRTNRKPQETLDTIVGLFRKWPTKLNSLSTRSCRSAANRIAESARSVTRGGHFERSMMHWHSRESTDKGAMLHTVRK